MTVKFVLKEHVRLLTNNVCMLTVPTIVLQFHCFTGSFAYLSMYVVYCMFF